MGVFKDYPNDYKATLGKGDWRTSDRENNTSVWQNANAYNIQQTNGSNEYVNLDQRADFYRWFQSSTEGKGFRTQWASAAAKTVDSLKKLLGLYDKIGMDISNTEIRNFVTSGNRLILDDIWISLQELYNGPVLKGKNAVNWDSQNLINEQHLIQAKYNALSPSSIRILNNDLFVGSFFQFRGNVLNLNHRYIYGMGNMGYIIKWEKGAKINTNVTTK